ncbi:MAG: DUF305 domain-containing protein [Bacteroidetes bacterium]|nr:DUF305 domain-containing protein [Bacteroidota bacterium]
MENTHDHKGMGEYKKLLVMVILSYISMFILMYAMVDSMPNVIININQFYMAGLMTAPMVIIELLVMRAMYPNKKLNLTITSLAVVGLVVFFICIRQQVGVGDKQFLKSMIPHHGAAILMVEKTPITDPDIKKLADGIIETQQKEIEQMKAKLKELEK